MSSDRVGSGSDRVGFGSDRVGSSPVRRLDTERGEDRTAGYNRRDVILQEMQHKLHCETDRLFAKLLLAQWVFAILLALVISPWSYDGGVRSLHFHVKTAIVGGALINTLPLALVYSRPGWWGTRHTIAVVQMLWSALLIMITGGRIETHFHVFGSLAFLAMYRDWKVLPTATIVVAADHLARGLLWPDSVYGIANPEWWRFLEHAAWVAFEDLVLVYACVRGGREMREAAGREARLERMKTVVERKVRERTEELHDNMKRYRSLVEGTATVPFELDADTLRILYIAPQATKLFECTLAEAHDDTFFWRLVHPDDVESTHGVLEEFAGGLRPPGESVDFRITTKSGRQLHLRTLLSSCDNHRVRGLMLDVTRQRQLELELQQAQKLESVGRLAAGVAHEINTPVQFVSDSVQFVRTSIEDLIGIVHKQQRAIDGVLSNRASSPRLALEATAAADAADLPYLADEMPKALERAVDGLDRVAAIVRSMKVFAHPNSERGNVDLNKAVESTLVIARNEYRYVADLVTHLGELPPVSCFGGEINQAILNVVLNAAHAMGDVFAQSGTRGTLTIRTARDIDHVVVSIEDTGGGIPEHVRARMFDPFFTTKQVGRGTGQGLSIARSVIVEKHGGTLSCDSKLGVGTTFHIRIPFSNAPACAEAA
jgi:signal transduction histidine kinase